MLKRLELKNKFKGLQLDFIDDLGDEIICYIKFNQSKKNIELAKELEGEDFLESAFAPYIVYDKEKKVFNAGYNQYILMCGNQEMEYAFTKNEIEYISKKLKKDLEKATKEN